MARKDATGPFVMMPFATVIMPIRNEEHFIARSLGAVLAQDYPKDRYEVLIADGMSHDSTRERIRSISQDAGVAIEIIDNPQQIVPTGFNLALARARGEIILRVDGHTIIAPDYVRQCVNLLLQTTADNVGGKMHAVGGTLFADAVALATSSRFGVGGASFHYSDREEWVDTVYMGAWRRELFDRVGAFDEEMVRNQDDEHNYRIRAQGGRILLSPAVRSTYYNRTTWRALWRQYFQYGYWKIRVMQKHSAQMRPRQFAPLALVLSFIVSVAFAPRFPRVALVAPVTYITGNLTMSFLVGKTHGFPVIWRLCIAFATLHLGYGTGFLLGLLKLSRCWKKQSSSRVES